MTDLYTSAKAPHQDTHHDPIMTELNRVTRSKDPAVTRENANVDSTSPSGMMNRFASIAARAYAREHLLSDETLRAIDDNLIHIHDLDYYVTGTTTCCQIPLGKLLATGFDTGHGFIRPPQSITTALSLAAIIFQSNQNQQHGGQSYQAFDHDLAPYVTKTNERHLNRLRDERPDLTEDERKARAWQQTDRDVYQACEAFIHNLNSLHSRSGGQVPFTSINYGTDTSKAGRLLIRNLLHATLRGLGNGETPIFPIQIMKLKAGVNLKPGDPNEDLYQLALKTTGKRLFPNFSFLDAPFNASALDEARPETEVAYMGCRTRVMQNRHGDDQSVGRGNLSFTSINLVRLALTSPDTTAFFHRLDNTVHLVIRQLLERFRYQCSQPPASFSFLFGEELWHTSGTLKNGACLADVLKHGTLSIGFIGLAEALVALTGSHHGEGDKAEALGLSIVRRLRTLCDEASDTHDMNITLIGTPAEGLSGRFVKHDQKQFGTIPGVTDRAYYTNSFHVPVYAQTTIAEKIRIEAPYHAFTNAGHISYIEVDGDVSGNLKAMDQIVQHMARSGMGYGSINHPVDRCLTCSHTGPIDTECPSCGNDNPDQIERIRRITGYLVGSMSRWNPAKTAEEEDRVKHR
ncbi:anaerobic ribonucleoside triphosphate reductase [Salisediminibacterium selenitireducens]|uniref:Anaerobic ribonucleoside-triphosphate reductase n=1 Tax=Bacillus selenitireducens (strain ATCC 700615 / DSM 15326 / MLS10) TaxID=439292 RepID=D6XWK1_BACIE|nr:anaerobic ribonucleoside-triphosphate reductase [[Bacillus] selenitireducens MLS10]